MKKDIIIYGAGIRGKKIACQLYRHGIEIAGFCDTFKIGEGIFECGSMKINKPIFSLLDVDRTKYTMIIAIADKEQYLKVQEKLSMDSISISTLDEILSGEDIVANHRELIAEYHIDNMNDYFKKAEEKESISVFWKKDSQFFEMFKELNLKKVVELACGRGRHVPQYISSAEEIVLVDILEKNIKYCKERFKEENNIQYYVNSGYELSKIESESCTSLFSYDALVHFELLDIFQYLKETERILIRGGKALFHHSNNTDDYKITFYTGNQGRNYMSKQLFAYLANRAGLVVLKQEYIDWKGYEKLDCLTLLEKRC